MSNVNTLPWQAKTLNMDAGCMIDAPLLCGAGYYNVLNYLDGKNHLSKMRNYMEKYIGKEIDKREVVNEFKSYYGLP